MASTVDQWDEDGERQSLHHSVRLYTPTELAAILRAAGLELVATYGGLAGGELTHESWRMVLVAEKPREQLRPTEVDRPAEPPWWEAFFEETFLHLWPSSSTPDDEPSEVEALVSLLALPPEGRILDLACGYGRIAVPLARRGFQVTGLDLSEPLLAIARERAAQAGVTVEWRRADMRDIPSEWSGQFDAVISIWNSFGYFADDHENQRVLAGAAQALKPGGRLLIDVSNRDRVVSTYRARDWDERDGLVLLQERAFDPVRGLNRTDLTWYEAGQRRQVQFAVRLYTPTELTRMVAAAGLRPVAYCGDWTGAELTRESRHIILIAEKP
jgi:2-polyprenyl-3-methyl-5-hydroxy-6-metoxy-1,4-benzoquinol methylase